MEFGSYQDPTLEAGREASIHFRAFHYFLGEKDDTGRIVVPWVRMPTKDRFYLNGISQRESRKLYPSAELMGEDYRYWLDEAIKMFPEGSGYRLYLEIFIDDSYVPNKDGQ